MRSLVGDPLGDFTTDAYLTPLINLVYEAQTTQLMSETDSSFDEWVFDVPGVPPGTTNLGIYQASQMPTANGNVQGPLYGLVTPIVVEWKLGGQSDDRYVEAGRTGKLPNISPAAPHAPYRMEWEWIHYIITLTPMSYVVDIRVRGEFSPPELVNDTDVLVVHPRMSTATAFGTGGLIGSERNNATYKADYVSEADSILEDISNKLTKDEQSTTTRIGRLGNRPRGWGGRW